MTGRLALICVALAVMTAAPALAQEADRPPMDVPIYPGGEPTLEINLTQEDLLPTLQAMLPLLGDKLKPLAGVNPEDIAAVLKDVRRVEVLQVDVRKPGVTESAVADFYSKNLPGGNWTRFFWQSREPTGTMALYLRDAGEYLYGYRVQTVKSGDEMLKRVTVGKIEGKIDFVKLMQLAGGLLMK